MKNNKSQSGMSMSNMLLVMALVGFLAVVGFRTIPVFMENLSINNILSEIEKDPSISVRDAKEQFSKRRSVDYIESINVEDLNIIKEDGLMFIGYEYERKIPLLGNASLVFEFSR